jgi:hypothetical protein
MLSKYKYPNLGYFGILDFRGSAMSDKEIDDFFKMHSRMMKVVATFISAIAIAIFYLISINGKVDKADKTAIKLHSKSSSKNK